MGACGKQYLCAQVSRVYFFLDKQYVYPPSHPTKKKTNNKTLNRHHIKTSSGNLPCDKDRHEVLMWFRKIMFIPYFSPPLRWIENIHGWKLDSIPWQGLQYISLAAHVTLFVSMLLSSHIVSVPGKDRQKQHQTKRTALTYTHLQEALVSAKWFYNFHVLGTDVSHKVLSCIMFD